MKNPVSRDRSRTPYRFKERVLKGGCFLDKKRSSSMGGSIRVFDKNVDASEGSDGITGFRIAQNGSEK